MHKNLRSLIDYSKDGIVSKEIFKTPKQNFTLFCMAKGTELSEHTSTKEGVVYVIEGKGIFVLEKEEIVMEPGKAIFLKNNAVHSLKAEENTAFILLLTN